MDANYLLISLPKSTSTDKNSLKDWLQTHINGGSVELFEYQLPGFKVGTLDSLVLQSEELGRIDQQLYGSIGKVQDIMAGIHGEGDATLVAKQKIDGKTVNQYLESFRWNTSRYRLDKPIEELINLISNEALNVDNDLRSSYANYNQARSNLVAAQRKQTGDLSVKSLHDIVRAEHFVLDSEHLQTVLLAVPKSLKDDFLNQYETLVEFVVPRSAQQIAQDAEYYLYSVTLFKKYVPAFLSKARDAKWVPRDFDYSEEVMAKMRNEYQEASKEEHTLKNDLLRLSKSAYSEIVSSWTHIKILRTFVESVLRYGLPPDFYSFLLRLPAKAISKSKRELIQRFGYLGGNAFAKDKKGNLVADAGLHEYASLVDQDYEPFVLYEISLS
ncbi:hypothetical protein KL921_000478 [Ogataea angusta]|uniref:V-type proton ATPase subunit C n=1 Tax=Pichia angusta TaxID=870730 RepID=A0AAN6DLA8_PICAN|nr:uncharacterized protein KL928_000313 [Ogataea angusta]KAG7814204.1 hypothetical protein KL921_000478 [Ogataea angusta]KAG7821838.1 hypothetical protein KL928_000313 [Ogataea angusta]KAG7825886.1 hypothetical protein KL909_001118 [Ogataea angusta]KAG7831185.1 hypothetical protein KL920_000705 [Ogataea angusta]KAG7837129.1 hypothetical protein KL943_001168 [Ogataea angusta]